MHGYITHAQWSRRAARSDGTCPAQDCSLLVHEATFGDTQTADALAKARRLGSSSGDSAMVVDGCCMRRRAQGHCTMSEAIGVAAAARAAHVVLVHFSARYPKLPRCVEAQPHTRTHNTNTHTHTQICGARMHPNCDQSLRRGFLRARDRSARSYDSPVHNVSIAFDLMTVTGATVALLPS